MNLATEARVRDWQRAMMEAHYLVEAVCEASHGGQGERLAGEDGGHYLVEAVCEASHGGQGEGLAESNDSPENEDEAGALNACTSTRQVQDKGCTHKAHGKYKEHTYESTYVLK